MSLRQLLFPVPLYYTERCRNDPKIKRANSVYKSAPVLLTHLLGQH